MGSQNQATENLRPRAPHFHIWAAHHVVAELQIGLRPCPGIPPALSEAEGTAAARFFSRAFFARRAAQWRDLGTKHPHHAHLHVHRLRFTCL